MTVSLLSLAALLGLRHAFEPDHLAAVAALVSRRSGGRDAARIAGAWAAGHGAVLLAVGGLMCAFRAILPDGVQHALDVLVGVVMVALGLDALRRRAPRRRATDERTGSMIEQPAEPAVRPAADPGGAGRALFVGALHGLEGSGAVVLAALPLSRSLAVLWLAVFAAATLVAMITCTLVIAAPLRAWRPRLMERGLPLACGAACVVVGCWLAARAVASGA